MSDRSLVDLNQHDPKRVAVIHHKHAWTYGEFERRSLRLARSLAAAGVEPGDRVAILLANCPEAVLLYLACFRAGFTIVPLDERYIAAQINFAIKHCGAKVLVTSTKRLPDIEECEAAKQVEHLLITGPDCPDNHRSFRAFVQTRSSTEITETHRGDDVAIVFYTSGTTSRPKGVTLTRDAVEIGIQKAAAVLRLTRDDVTLIAAPIARPFALRTQLLPTFAAGGTVKLHSRFDPDRFVRDLRRKPAVTFLALLPVAVRNVLEHPDLSPDDLKHVRLFICGGDRVPLDLFDRIQNFAGIELVEQCGMTETGMYAVNPPYGRKKPGSIG
ncbi:MAG: long-chain fatty acid--CoA ligase, partial [Planctomycetota bacterium]|nr:long-chain fatty acid--CoA ligase [Planctomycetota bacterium]